MKIISDFRKIKSGKLIIWVIGGLLFVCVVCSAYSIFRTSNDIVQDAPSKSTDSTATLPPIETKEPQPAVNPLPTNTDSPTKTPTITPTSTPLPEPTPTEDKTREVMYGELGKTVSIDGLLVTVEDVKVFGPPPESGHLDGITYILVEITNESNPESVRINSNSFAGIDEKLGENSGEWDYTVEEKLGVIGFRQKESETLDIGDSASGWIGVRGMNLQEFIFDRNILPSGRKSSTYYDILHIPILPTN